VGVEVGFFEDEQEMTEGGGGGESGWKVNGI